MTTLQFDLPTAIPVASSSLLAQQNRWEEMGSGFRGERAELDVLDLVVGVTLIVLAVVSVWILSRLMAVQDRRRVYNSPPKLFKGLCAAHQLNRAESRLLTQLARQAGLAQPALLFLEPQRFSPNALVALSQSQRKQAEALGKKLFAA